MHLLAAAAERERKREILSDLCGRSEINVFGCGQLCGWLGFAFVDTTRQNVRLLEGGGKQERASAHVCTVNIDLWSIIKCNTERSVRVPYRTG